MELAGGFAKPGDDQHLGQSGPGDLRVDIREEFLQKIPQAELLDERQGKPHIAEASGTLHAHTTGIDFDPGRRRRFVKERSLDSRVTQRGLFHTEQAGFVRVAEIRNNQLAWTAFSPDGFNQRPVVPTRVMLLNRDLAEKHAVNIQPHIGPAQDLEFSLHDTFGTKGANTPAIANFGTNVGENIFQLSNLG